MKKLKYAIFIVLSIIVIGIMVLLLVKKDNIEENKKDDIYYIPPKSETNLKKETTMLSFIQIDELVNQFFLYINQKYGDIDNKEAAYYLLEPKVIEENNITKENILDKFNNFTKMNSYSTKDMYVKQIYRSQFISKEVIYLKGTFRAKGNIIDVYMCVKKDNENNSYNIRMINEKEYTSDITNGIEENIEFSIEKNNYNYVSQKTLKDEDICSKHLLDYRNACVNNEEEAYNLLDKEYREKRFGSLEKFKEYRHEKIETLGKEYVKEYLVNRYNDYNEYVCKDMYGNLYIFTEKYPMQYTLKLDTYTINTEKFIKEYDEGNNQKKVQLNINKFILMINNQDYTAAYNVLDSEFKKNNFDTEEKFKEYVKKYMYRYNDIKFNTYDVKGNLYLFNVSITDKTNGVYKDDTRGSGGTAYILDWNFVVQLKDNRNFALAFEVQ